MDDIIILSDNEDEHCDISAILKKYESYEFKSESTNKKIKISNDISPNTSEDESDYTTIKKKTDNYLLNANNRNSQSPEAPTSKINASPTYKSPVTFEVQDNLELPNVEKTKPRKRKQNAEEKQQEKLRKEQEKLQKKEERERLKAQLTEEKAQKAALSAAYKSTKPEECMKYITAVIDSELLQAECGAEIPLIMQTTEVKFTIKSQPFPNSVTWERDNQAQLVGVNGQLGLSKEKDECDEIILILQWNEFVNYIYNKNFCDQIKMKRSLYPNKKISLGVYGMSNYYRFHKNKKPTNKSDHKYLEAPKIRKKDVEFALIELQMLFGMSTRFLENPKDVGYMIAQYTKSIAQAPFKLQKAEKQQQMDWYVAGCNKDTVRVDKNGNGLTQLWRQQLTQFTMARLETAEAICLKYPSANSLFKAYNECSEEEGLKLLQDLPIRRAAGPLTNVKRLGPELSRKVYTLFNVTNGDVVI